MYLQGDPKNVLLQEGNSVCKRTFFGGHQVEVNFRNVFCKYFHVFVPSEEWMVASPPVKGFPNQKQWPQLSHSFCSMMADMLGSRCY